MGRKDKYQRGAISGLCDCNAAALTSTSYLGMPHIPDGISLCSQPFQRLVWATRPFDIAWFWLKTAWLPRHTGMLRKHLPLRFR